MSIRVMTWLWENSPAKGTDLLVLLAIADNADDNGGNAWPSVRTLALKCRTSERSIQRALRSLEAAGFLDVKQNAGRSGTHRFRIDMTKGRQLGTPDNLSPLTPRQSDTGGDTHVTGGVTPVSPEPSLNRPEEPPTPNKLGACSTTNPIHKRCRACGTSKRAVAQAVKNFRPPWCKDCDQHTRMVELHDGRMARCPHCHPLVVARREAS